MSSRLLQCLATTEELATVFSDRSLLEAMLAFESALARAQAKLGMIPASAAAAISRAAIPANFDSAAIARAARESASIAIPLVQALTARVREIDQAAADFVHCGTTSQDVLDTAMVLVLRQGRCILTRDSARLFESLRQLSERYAGTPMLARTLLQPAPPTTFGYKAAGWYGAASRSWGRLDHSLEDALRLQFGGASGTLASFGRDGLVLARELAAELEIPMADAPWHANRDRLAAMAADCAIYTACMGKVARDISLLMQQEIGEVAETGGGSSSMPHKRNPSGCAIVLAAANRTPGLVSSFLSGMVQEHERAVGGWQAEWPVLAALVEATGSAIAALCGVIDGLTVYPERMRANIEATDGAVFSEKANSLLIRRLGRDAAREALTATRPLREVVAAFLTPEELEKIDRPEDYLGSAEEFRRNLLKDNASH